MSGRATARPAFSAFLVQSWRGTVLRDEIRDLSYNAAREIARVHSALGDTVRVWADNGRTDYIEVYQKGRLDRSGTFAETVRVHL